MKKSILCSYTFKKSTEYVKLQSAIVGVCKTQTTNINILIGKIVASNKYSEMLGFILIRGKQNVLYSLRKTD